MTVVAMITRLALAALICIALAHTTSALDPDDPEYWVDTGSAALYKGDTYSVGDYTVRFVDYEPETDHVRIALWRGDRLLNESVLNASCTDETVCDHLNWDDEVNITIVNETEDDPASENPTFWQNPCIHIEFLERAKPEISIDIDTGCETYTALDSEIRVTVEIENEGDADLERMSVTIDSDDLQMAGSDTTRHLGNLTIDDEKTIYARLRVPSWVSETEGESFVVTVNVTGFDYRDAMYTESASTEILVLPRFDLEVRKTVNKHISMDQSAWVRIDLENTGKRDLDVVLNDTVPQGFRLCGNVTATCWRFNITPFESVQVSYRMKPEMPGVFEIPGAVAGFVMGERNITMRSNAPTITVDGAYVIVTKTAYPANVSLGDVVTVALNVTNTGNRDAIINLTDVLPEGASLVSGNTTLSATLAANRTEEIEYAISFSVPGTVALSAPMVAVTSDGYSCVVVSGTPVIAVLGSLPDAFATATPDARGEGGDDAATSRSKDVPVYEILLMVCVLAAVYLVGRFR